MDAETLGIRNVDKIILQYTMTQEAIATLEAAVIDHLGIVQSFIDAKTAEISELTSSLKKRASELTQLQTSSASGNTAAQQSIQALQAQLDEAADKVSAAVQQLKDFEGMQPTEQTQPTEQIAGKRSKRYKRKTKRKYR